MKFAKRVEITNSHTEKVNSEAMDVLTNLMGGGILSQCIRISNRHAYIFNILQFHLNKSGKKSTGGL